MLEIAITYSIVALFGLFSTVVSISRLVIATNSESRNRAALSLLGAILIILISIVAFYLSLYEIFSRLTVALLSGVFLGLNFIAFRKYSKPES